MNQERKVLHRRNFYCTDPERLVAFFKELGPFQAVVEATASYEWLVSLIEPLADRVLLAIPNRWLSASRLVGPSSIHQRTGSPHEGDLPPPPAQENVRGKARPLSRASAEMGRSTDADGERERARASPVDSLHRRLDKRCFIDGMGPGAPHS